MSVMKRGNAGKSAVSITIKDAVKLGAHGKKSMFVSFSYDAQLVSIVKSMRYRWYDPTTKVWEIPVSCQDDLRKDLMSAGKTFSVIGDLPPVIVEKPKATVIASLSATFPDWFTPKTKPFPHQVEGFNFGMERDRFVLGDDQGLGKTFQIINIAIGRKIKLGYRRCLIICGVNGLKYNWMKEIEKHSTEKGHILGMRWNSKGLKVGGNAEKIEDLSTLPDAFFLITNIESLRNPEIVARLQELCELGEIDMIAFDEAHKCKNGAAEQTKGLLKLQAKCMIPMTGTPLLNSPLDLWVSMHWLGYEPSNFYRFRSMYCEMGGYGGHEVVGYKNMDRLHERFSGIMLRRLKRDVLDLPDKIYSVEYVEMGAKQKKIYDGIRKELLENIDRVLVSNNPLAQLIRLRQATGYTGILSSSVKESAKLDRLVELAEDISANGEKFLVFSNWTQITQEVETRLEWLNPAVITGETSPEERQRQEKKFMEDPSCKVIIGTIGAMGTGLTLTAGATVIFMDQAWTDALQEQAIDRAHRIGTKSNVNIITLLTKGTIDEKIFEIVQEKGAIADALIDGEITSGNESIVRYLLGI